MGGLRNSDQDMNELFRRIYDTANEKDRFQNPCLGWWSTLADYNVQGLIFVADQEINMVAFLTEIMIESEF